MKTREVLVKLVADGEPVDGLQKILLGNLGGDHVFVGSERIVEPLIELKDLDMDETTQLIVVPKEKLSTQEVKNIADGMNKFMKGSKCAVFDQPVSLYVVRRNKEE